MNGNILRYKGSKWRVRKTIRALAPHEYDWYAEPFLGGGAILFEQPPEIPRFANDRNWDIYNLWQNMRDNGLVERCIDLRERSMQMDKSELMELFEQMKSELVFKNDPLAYFYLNRFAHQHLVLRGRKDIASFDAAYIRCGIRPVRPEILHEARALLQGVELHNLDFEAFLRQVEKTPGRGWIFVDPPYWINDHGSPFYSLFTAEDHERLFEWMRQTQHYVSLTVGDDCKTHRLYRSVPEWNSLPMFYRYQSKMHSRAARPLKREWLIRNFS